MEKELLNSDKELLLKDLCARLPYGVKVKVDFQSDTYSPIVCKVCSVECAEIGSAFIGVEISPDTYNEFREFLCKPYLFPLSSMTPKQKAELSMLVVDVESIFESFLIEVEFYHKHHIDYRGLIPMGLAVDATGLNIY